MASPLASSTPPPASASHAAPAGIAGWRVILRIAGALFAVAIFSYWAAAGANTGWTKDRVTIMKTDEITGIVYPEHRKHFVPGLEFLALGCGFGLALIGVTFFRNKTKHTS